MGPGKSNYLTRPPPPDFSTESHSNIATNLPDAIQSVSHWTGAVYLQSATVDRSLTQVPRVVQKQITNVQKNQ